MIGLAMRVTRGVVRILPGNADRDEGHSLGFTLVEVLIAVSILGTVAATIYLSFSTGMEAQSRVEAVSENLGRARFATEIMTDDLTNPGLISAVSFEGWRTGFRMGLGGVAGSAAGADQVEYRLAGEGREEQALVRRLLRGEEILSETRLASGVDSLQVLYCLPDARGSASWLGEWERSWGLPFAVRVSVSARGDGGGPARHERLIPLPPSWLRPPITGAVRQSEAGP